MSEETNTEPDPRPDSRQFVRVEFCRGGSIAPGEPRHPWHWAILIQRGHIWKTSDSFGTFAECLADFEAIGAAEVPIIEKEMQEAYRGVDLSARNETKPDTGGEAAPSGGTSEDFGNSQKSTDEAGFQSFVDELAQDCKCCPDCQEIPCDGLLAGGPCDNDHCKCDD